MILDSSAVVAIIGGEEGSERFHAAIEEAPEVGIGAPTAAESAIVLTRRFGDCGRELLTRFMTHGEVVTIPFGPQHWLLAAEAYARYGKGRHPARLNYGDCMAYATARLAELPLLCVGRDFARTDLALVAT